MKGRDVATRTAWIRAALLPALAFAVAGGWSCAFPPYEVVDGPDAGNGGGTGGTGGTGTGGGAGGAPSSCWDSPVEDFVEDLSFSEAVLAGVNPHSPFVTPEGLSLYYIATDINGNVTLFKATRSDRGTNFSGGVPEPVTGWSFTPLVDYPALAFDGAELLVTRDYMLYVSLWNNNSWGPFAAVVTSEPAEMHGESLHSLTKDGERLIFQRNDGPVIPVNGSTTLERFHEVVRTPAVPGGAFGSPAPVGIPTLTSGNPAFPHGLYCPALSADGTRLFFASNREEVTQQNIAFVLKLAMVRRASRTAPWGQPEWLPDALNSTDQETCASSITEDGCEIYYHYFGGSGAYTIHVARRSPP
jgi:hypothetical protein